MTTPPTEITVLCVCTHNRSRSVLMHGVLHHHLRDLGVGVAVVSAGTRADGGPVSREAVELLAPLQIDMSQHRGTSLGDDLIAAADLIVTAERDHVVHIAARWPQRFASTFTLPELMTKVRRHGGRLGGPIDDWIDLLNTGRSAGRGYFDDDSIGEIADPTGRGRREWAAAYALVDDHMRRLAHALT